MSWRHKRARDRRALHEVIRAGFQVELEALLDRVQSPANVADRIDTTDRIRDLFQRIERSPVPLWPLVQQAFPEVPHDKGIAEDREAVLAMIAQIVARHLAAMTPGSVHKRHKLAQ